MMDTDIEESNRGGASKAESDNAGRWLNSDIAHLRTFVSYLGICSKYH